MRRQHSLGLLSRSTAIVLIPLAAISFRHCLFDESAPVERDGAFAQSEFGALPISIEVDGRAQALVHVPEGLFDGGWTTNFTQSEIGAAGKARHKPGSSLYPTGSLDKFDLARYLSSLDKAVRLHVPENATGVAALDFEDGLSPWLEKSRDKYKAGLRDDEFERFAHRFFIQSLRTAKAARPNAKWCFWGYPRPWQNNELIERMADIYAECTALTPSLYINRSGDADAITRFVGRVGQRVATIKGSHPNGDELVVAAYLWDHNVSFDHRQPRAQASLEDMITTARAAEPWADLLVIWLAASTEEQAEQLNRDLGPGGRIRTFIETYRRGR